MNLRAPTEADVPAITRLINLTSEELFGATDETEEEVAMFLQAPELDPQQDIRVAVTGAEVVGYVDVAAHPHPRYWIDLRVPVSASDESRSALVEWALGRAREQEAKTAMAFSWSEDAALKAALESAGFRRIRGSYRMRIDFDGDLERAVWPEGVSVRSMTPVDEERAYEAHEESFADMWGHTREPVEEWRHWLLTEDHDWSLWFLAEADGEVAGVALCRRRPSEPEVGVVRVLGVRRPWRRQGVGRALLQHAFAEFRARGCEAVELGVDAESLTGAQRLYERAGMRVVRQSDIYELELA